MEYRYLFGLLAVYYVCFLMITPLGAFNPGVPEAHSYSLTRIDRDDDMEFYVKAKSLIVDWDFDYNNAPFHSEALCDLNKRANPKASSITPIGPGILWAPFVAIAHVLTITLNALWTMELPDDGFSNLYLAITCIGSSLYAFLGLVISFTILTRYFSPCLSFIALITVFIGNTLFYNTYVRMLMSHSPEFFTTALFILLYIKVHERGRLEDYLLFGLSYGLLGIVRYENLFLFALMPIIDCIYAIVETTRNRNIRLISIKIKYYMGSLGAAFFVFSLQFLYFYIQTGELIPYELREAGNSIMRTRPNISELFWGPTRNILWGNPIVMIGGFGSLFFIKRDKRLGMSLSLIIIAAIFWIFWRPHVYWWGMDFGIRHLIKISVPLAFGYAALIKVYPLKYKKFLFGGISLVIILWEYLKIVQTPLVTPILSEDFLSKALMKIPEIISTRFPSFFLGTESSYLRVLSEYGIHLRHWNLRDFLYLVALPLYVLLFGLAFLILYLFLPKRFNGSIHDQRILIVSLFFLTLAFLIGGIFYPSKSSEKLYNEFRQAGVIGYMKGRYGATDQCFQQALAIKSVDDPVIKGIIYMIKNKITWPLHTSDNIVVETLSAASKDTSKIIRVFGEDGLVKLPKRELFIDFGTSGTRQFLKDGWGEDEGPYPSLGFPTFVWGTGSNSIMAIIFDKKRDYLMTFRSISFTSEQEISLRLNGRYIMRIPLSTKWEDYSVKIQSPLLKKGENIFDFHYKHSQAPLKAVSKDTRKLAVAFDWILFQ